MRKILFGVIVAVLLVLGSISYMVVAADTLSPDDKNGPCELVFGPHDVVCAKDLPCTDPRSKKSCADNPISTPPGE